MALSLGDIAFVERPLYDYVQHGEATLGHAAANRMPGMRERVGALRRDPHERVRLWRMHYYVDACRLLQFAAVLRLRFGDADAGRTSAATSTASSAPTARSRRSPRSPGAARRSCSGAAATRSGPSGCCSTPSPGGACWRRARATARRAGCGSTRCRRPRWIRGRARASPPSRRRARSPRRSRRCGSPSATTRPRRVNLLIPSIDLEHFFGGYIGKFNFARRLAARGVRVRIVTVDPVGSLPASWREDVEAYSGLAGLLGEVEVAFGRESQGLEVSRADAFVATTWWTAHIAHAALRTLDAQRFLYLIQEYEPFTFPMGTHAALAAESYRFPHAALFSTELLRDYFRRHGIGVYAAGAEAGDRDSASFDNAITAIDPPGADELAGRRPRRLLFYARPEPHAARNMFELGVLALSRALERGAFADGWTLHGIGTVRAGRRLDLGGGALLELLPRSPQAAYGQRLREHDVGLALMYTPHPSLVPLEMASAGLLTVTNTFENKTAEALASISSNLIAAEPGIEAVAAALCDAAAGADDVERRLRGSRVRWPPGLGRVLRRGRAGRGCSACWKADAAPRHRGGLQDRRRRLAVEREAVDDLLEVLDVADVGADQVAVLARHAQALDDLGRLHGERRDLVQLARRGAHADDHAEREAERARVDVGAVAADHAAALEPREPVRDRRGREADAAAELGERQPGVGLQLGDQGEVGVVQGGIGDRAVLPWFRRHAPEHTCEMPCEPGCQARHRVGACDTASRRPTSTSSSARSSTTSARPSPCCCSPASRCSASRGCGSPPPRWSSRCGGARGACSRGSTAPAGGSCSPGAACWRS